MHRNNKWLNNHFLMIKAIQHINTFEELYSYIEENGIYFCEDMHTSYLKGWGGGGYRKKGTFIEYSKNFIDYINV